LGLSEEDDLQVYFFLLSAPTNLLYLIHHSIKPTQNMNTESAKLRCQLKKNICSILSQKQSDIKTGNQLILTNNGVGYFVMGETTKTALFGVRSGINHQQAFSAF